MDFLTFKKFISTEALIIFYYIGAIVLPVVTWLLVMWLVQKYDFIQVVYENKKEILWRSLNSKQKIKVVMFFVSCFLFMELFWRMLFEFLIAYMQIRDALLCTQL